MISGTLPNNTVWWISKDGKKVWIESNQLENQKFIDKGYNIVKDRIFNPKIKKQVGELAGSRLERRLYKDSWVITLDTFLDIYPDLIPEIGNKSIEEKKKKRQTKSITKSTTPKTLPQKIIEKSYFDVTCPYVEWIKGEIDKSPNGELKILSDDMKEKMGKEYLNMHDIRIYFGLKKISTEIGIDVELGKSEGRSLLIMKRTGKVVT